MEVTVRFDMDIDSDKQKLNELLSDTEDGSIEGEPEGEPSLPSEGHRLVYQAVKSNPRHALRVYHQDLVDDPNTPYTDYDGWNEERKDVRSKMWDLEELGHLENKGQLWMLPEDAE